MHRPSSSSSAVLFSFWLIIGSGLALFIFKLSFLFAVLVKEGVECEHKFLRIAVFSQATPSVSFAASSPEGGAEGQDSF